MTVSKEFQNLKNGEYNTVAVPKKAYLLPMIYAKPNAYPQFSDNGHTIKSISNSLASLTEALQRSMNNIGSQSEKIVSNRITLAIREIYAATAKEIQEQILQYQSGTCDEETMMRVCFIDISA